jgi:cell division protein FtsL
MKKIIIVLLLAVIINVGKATPIEGRVTKLEQTVKTQSDSLAIYKAKVAEVEMQKNFLSDIYSTNIGWVSLVLSILIAGVFGLTVYNVVDNSKKVKNITSEYSTLNKKLQKKFKKKTTYIEKYVYSIAYDLNRTNAILSLKEQSHTYSVYYHLNALKARIQLFNLLSDDEEIQIYKTLIKTDLTIIEDKLKTIDYFENYNEYKLFENIVNEIIDKSIPEFTSSLENIKRITIEKYNGKGSNVQ